MVLLPSTTTLSCSNVSSENLVIDDDQNDYIDADMFFPALYEEDYYDYVEFDNNAKPIIKDKFIFKVIEDVVNRVSTSTGLSSFSVDKKSNSSVDFNFRWDYNGNVLFKTYSFEIGK